MQMYLSGRRYGRSAWQLVTIMDAVKHGEKVHIVLARFTLRIWA